MLNELASWQPYLDAHHRAFAHQAGSFVPKTPAEFQAFLVWQDERTALFDASATLRTQVIAELRDGDFEQILDLVKGDRITDEQRGAVFLIVELVRKKAPRLTADLRERWAQMLEHKVGRSYPGDSSALQFLREIDADRAKAALLSAVARLPLAELSTKDADILIRDSPVLGTDRVELLRRFAGAGGEIAAKAEHALELGGDATPARIDEVAAAWRRDRDRKTLNWIYNAVISHIREGVEPVDRVRTLLGEPTDEFTDALIYETREENPIQLNIGIGRDRKIVSWKLK
jgi:hypothetical protein